jgi:hypothetical protein
MNEEDSNSLPALDVVQLHAVTHRHAAQLRRFVLLCRRLRGAECRERSDRRNQRENLVQQDVHVFFTVVRPMPAAVPERVRPGAA